MPVRKPWRPALSIVIAIAGFATAMLVGIAVAKSFTLKVEKNAKVVNGNTSAVKHETIAISHGFAVYTLSGDSKSHPKCVSMKCLGFWPPLTVKSANNLSKAPGIHGTLGIWTHKGFNQVTLGGHPLYKFSGDTGNGVANGEAIVAFGGTWHVVKASAAAGSGPGGGSSSTTTTATSTSTTTSHWG